MNLRMHFNNMSQISLITITHSSRTSLFDHTSWHLNRHESWLTWRLIWRTFNGVGAPQTHLTRPCRTGRETRDVRLFTAFEVTGPHPTIHLVFPFLARIIRILGSTLNRPFYSKTYLNFPALTRMLLLLYTSMIRLRILAPAHLRIKMTSQNLLWSKSFL